jgi:hypothetical protein
MSIHSRYWIAVATIGAGTLLGAVLHEAISPVFGITPIVAAIAGAVYLMSLSCKKCGQTLLYREGCAFGRRVKAWWPTLPKACPACGQSTSED